MSKAFTRESDDAPERPLPRRPAARLAPEGKNYITADGAARLESELQELLAGDAGAAGGAAGQRVAEIRHILRTTVPVQPPETAESRIRFGARVTLRRADGSEPCYRIVGLDEADPDQGWISWLSPLATALLRSEKGQSIHFRFPSGEEPLEILDVQYASGPSTP